MVDLTQEKIQLQDPNEPSVQEESVPALPDAEQSPAPEQTVDETQEEQAPEKTLEEEQAALERAQQVTKREEARTGPPRGRIEDAEGELKRSGLSDLSLPDAPDAFEFFVKKALPIAKTVSDIQESGLVETVRQSVLYRTEPAKALALDFDELSKNPEGGQIIYDRLYSHPDPKINQTQQDIINGTDTTKPIGFLTNIGPRGGNIPGSTARDGSLNVKELDLVKSLRTETGKVSYADAPFDLKMKKMGEYSGVAVVYEATPDDSEGVMWDTDGDGRVDKRVRIFPLNNNAKHAALLGRSVVGDLTQGEKSMLSELTGQPSPEDYIRRVETGQVQPLDFFDTRYEADSDAERYDRIMVLGGVPKNQRIIALQAHHSGIRETATGPGANMFNFFTVTLPNIGISLLNNVRPASYAATPYIAAGDAEEAIGRNRELLEDPVTLPAMLIGAQQYVDMITSGKMTSEELETLMPEKFGEEGAFKVEGNKISMKYFDSVAKKYAELTGISVQAASEVLRYADGFIEPAVRDLPAVLTFGGGIRFGGMALATSKYADDFLPFMLRKLNLKNEVEYRKFLKGGRDNLSKAFEAREDYFVNKAGVVLDIPKRVNPNADIIEKNFVRTVSFVANIPRKASNFWKGMQQNILQKQLEIGGAMTTSGKRSAAVSLKRDLKTLENKYTKKMQEVEQFKVTDPKRAAQARIEARNATVQAQAESILYSMNLRRPYALEFYKEEGKALLAYGIGQYTLNEVLFRNQTQHSFVAELGSTIGAYILANPVIGVTKGTGEFFANVIQGQTVSDAMSVYGSAERKARNVGNNFLNGLSGEEQQQFMQEVGYMQDLYTKLLGVQEKAGVTIFTEEMSLPLTLGQFIGNSEMMAVAQAVRAERHVSDLKDLPRLLNAEKTIAQQQVEFNQKLLNLTEAVLVHKEYLDEDSTLVLQNMRDYASANLEQYNLNLKEIQAEYDSFEEQTISLLQTGGGHVDADIPDGFSQSNLVDVITSLEDEAFADTIGREVSTGSVLEHARRIETLARAKNEATRKFVETAKNPANGTDQPVINSAIGNHVRGEYETVKKEVGNRYAELENSVIEVDPDTGEREITTFADMYSTFVSIRDRGSLDPDVFAMDSNNVLARKVTDMNVNIPKERQTFAVADAAAERHFRVEYGGDISPQAHVQAIHERLPDTLKEKYPLPEDINGRQLRRSIDMWGWKDNLYREITEEEFTAAKEVFDPEDFDNMFQGAESADDLRYFDEELEDVRSTMDLPFSPLEYWELRKSFNASANSGKDEKTRRIAKNMREDLDKTEFIDNYGTDNETLNTDFKDRLQQANKYAKDNFYDRFDSKVAKQMIFDKKDALVLDNMLGKSLKKIEGDSDDLENALYMEQEVVSDLAKIFGGVKDPETGLYVFVEGEGSEIASSIFVSYANNMYLKSDAGTYLSNAAKNDKVGLGTAINVDGVEFVNLISKSATQEQRKILPNQYARQTRALMNIKVYRQTTDANGDTVLDKSTPARMFNENEIIDFANVENIGEIERYRKPMIEAQKDFVRRVKESKGDKLEALYRDEQDILKSMQRSADSTLSGGLDIQKTQKLGDFIFGSDGPEAIRLTRAEFINKSDLPEEQAAKRFDNIMKEIVAKKALEKVRVINKQGETEIDLAALYGLLNDPGTNSVLKEFGGPEDNNVVDSLSTILEMGKRLTARDPEQYRIAGKPLRVNPESFINKAWQVSRNTVSPRYLALEAIFRTTRRSSFDYMISVITDVKVANSFSKIAVDGYVADQTEFGAMYDIIMTYTANNVAKQHYYGKSEDERPNFRSKRDFESKIDPYNLEKFTGQDFLNFQNQMQGREQLQ